VLAAADRQAEESVVIRTEVCVDAVAGARAAATGGADRIELCAALETGGLTPSIGLQEAVADACELPRHVLIRPRQGDFCWDVDEIDQMVRDIRAAVAAGAAAPVIGALTSRGEVDIDATARLRDAADGSPVTFNRAFDRVGDQRTALDVLRQLGIRRVLTSGGTRTALEGATRLAELVRRAGDDITILAGAGITPVSAAEVVRTAGVREIHFSARRPWTPGRVAGSDVSLGAGEDRLGRTSVELVAATVAAVAGL
jgi:copper homeostasis protein